MSISEARRQINLAEELCSIAEETLGKEQGTFYSVITHVGNALVEAIAENRPYDGSLNNIRVPVSILRQLTVELVQNNIDDIGLEDLAVSLRARIRKTPTE